MNVVSLWQYTHQALIGALDHPTWEREVWPQRTLKDAITNLTAMEYVLCEVLESMLDDSPTPTLDRFVVDYDRFNREEIAERRTLSGDEVLEEYRYIYAQTSRLMTLMPGRKWRERGTLPWYGPDFSLEEFVVLFLFEHKREAVAQIMQANHEHSTIS